MDLYRALKYRGSKYDVVLQEGDVIYIPEINPFVSVGGAVQSPLKIAFDKEHTSLGYYIDKAGGFGIRPWRRRIYVKYASGKVSAQEISSSFISIRKWSRALW